MPEITTLVEIDATPEKVFSLLLPDKLALWFDTVENLEVVRADSTPITPGDCFTLKSDRETMTVKVIEYVPLERFAWKSVEGRASGFAFYLKMDEGYVIVEVTETYESRNLVGRLLDRPFVQKMMKDTLTANLDRLKEVAELDTPLSPDLNNQVKQADSNATSTNT